MNDNKQRLFEVLSKIDKTFKPKLNEAKMYVNSSEIPPQIIAWAKSIVGSGFQNKITVEKVKGKVEIGMPWHDADRETHYFFKLNDNGAEAAGKPISNTGWSETSMYNKSYGTVEIPSGYVLATVGTYPKRLEIYVADDAMDLISNNNEVLDKLSDDAMVALYNAVSLKSFARQKFNDNVYQELISLGLLNSQKAITINGRNAIKSPEAMDRLKSIHNKDVEDNGQWSTKYKINI